MIDDPGSPRHGGRLSLVFRPDPALVRHRPPVRGLYLAGASVRPGGGVDGACGAGAARAVLHDRSRALASR